MALKKKVSSQKVYSIKSSCYKFTGILINSGEVACL